MTRIWQCPWKFGLSLKDLVRFNDSFRDLHGFNDALKDLVFPLKYFRILWFFNGLTRISWCPWGFGAALIDLVSFNDTSRGRQGFDDGLEDLVLPLKIVWDLTDEDLNDILKELMLLLKILWDLMILQGIDKDSTAFLRIWYVPYRFGKNEWLLKDLTRIWRCS